MEASTTELYSNEKKNPITKRTTILPGSISSNSSNANRDIRQVNDDDDKRNDDTTVPALLLRQVDAETQQEHEQHKQDPKQLLLPPPAPTPRLQEMDVIAKSLGRRQVVHRHANGLVIVTAGSILAQVAADSNKTTTETTTTRRAIKAIHFRQEPAAIAKESAASKRKQQSKLLKQQQKQQDKGLLLRRRRGGEGGGEEGGNGNQQPNQSREPGIVFPTDVLAQVEFETIEAYKKDKEKQILLEEGMEMDATEEEEVDKEKDNHKDCPRMNVEDGNNNLDNNNNNNMINLYACVWGSILELNRSISPNVLANDPLLDGYLAIILPTGSFPPTTSSTTT